MTDRFQNMKDGFNALKEKAIEKSNDNVFMWMLRVATFLVYAGTAGLLLGLSNGKDACHVQITYRQEFLAKIVSNPFYSSSQVFFYLMPEHPTFHLRNFTWYKFYTPILSLAHSEINSKLTHFLLC